MRASGESAKIYPTSPWETFLKGRSFFVSSKPFLDRKDLGRKKPEVDPGSSKAMTLPLRLSRFSIPLSSLVKIRLWYSAMPPFQRLRSIFPAPWMSLTTYVG